MDTNESNEVDIEAYAFIPTYKKELVKENLECAKQRWEEILKTIEEATKSNDLG